MNKHANTQMLITPPQAAKQKIAALLILYLPALMASHGLSETDYLAAKAHIKQIGTAL